LDHTGVRGSERTSPAVAVTRARCRLCSSAWFPSEGSTIGPTTQVHANSGRGSGLRLGSRACSSGPPGGNFVCEHRCPVLVGAPGRQLRVRAPLPWFRLPAWLSKSDSVCPPLRGRRVSRVGAAGLGLDGSSQLREIRAEQAPSALTSRYASHNEDRCDAAARRRSARCSCLAGSRGARIPGRFQESSSVEREPAALPRGWTSGTSTLRGADLRRPGGGTGRRAVRCRSLGAEGSGDSTVEFRVEGSVLWRLAELRLYRPVADAAVQHMAGGSARGSDRVRPELACAVAVSVDRRFASGFRCCRR
jgi:hypothetical protein